MYPPAQECDAACWWNNGLFFVQSLCRSNRWKWDWEKSANQVNENGIEKKSTSLIDEHGIKKKSTSQIDENGIKKKSANERGENGLERKEQPSFETHTRVGQCQLLLFLPLALSVHLNLWHNWANFPSAQKQHLDIFSKFWPYRNFREVNNL